jgi:hypothetical protein
MYYFRDDSQIVKLFSILLSHEGDRFYNRTLLIWGKDEFMNLLRRNKWIYDPDLHHFFLDPFYEREINFLKQLRVIDLRSEADLDEMIHAVGAVSSTMSGHDLEWRITMRLYDIERKSGELIRKIINMLLLRQNLQAVAGEMFICLKELAINASKANYKRLFEKHVTAPNGITCENNYLKFLELFRNEIEENGNSRLFEFAKADDRFISITFQSAKEFIEIWVTNHQNLSPIEKEQIFSRIEGDSGNMNSFVSDEDYTEGAGLGLNIVLNVLNKYSAEKNSLKVVFYPDYIKIGFLLRRSDLQRVLSAAV